MFLNLKKFNENNLPEHFFRNVYFKLLAKRKVMANQVAGNSQAYL